MRVVGIAKAVENLRLMGEAITKRVTRKAVRQATRVIMLQIRATTYSGDRQQRTGLMRRSLSITTNISRAGRVVGKVVMRPVNISGRSKVAQRVRAKRTKLGNATAMHAFYWRFLEKGTAQRTTQSGANRGRVHPSPWVEPAFDAKSGEAIDMFARIFNRETEAEARKLDKGVGR